MKLSDSSKAGLAFFVGAVQFGIFLVVSEIIYSANGTGGYSVSANYVSDLGANCRGSTCYIPPSALLFNSTVALFGILTIVGAYFLHRSYRWVPATLVLALAGIGTLGVGLFPETTGIFHVIFSFITFLFAGLSAVITAKLLRKPVSYFSIILGTATLVALALVVGGLDLGLGVGGIERMVIYPSLFWAVSFGVYMMSTEHRPSVVDTPSRR
jgi:hypothetical membrane protein